MWEKMNKNTIIAITCTAMLGISGVSIAGEECYGIVKAGENECATKSSACAGHALIDGQKDAYITIPNGLCAKLVGGSLEPEE